MSKYYYAEMPEPARVSVGEQIDTIVERLHEAHDSAEWASVHWRDKPHRSQGDLRRALREAQVAVAWAEHALAELEHPMYAATAPEADVDEGRSGRWFRRR